jgi:hypothetical protein
MSPVHIREGEMVEIVTVDRGQGGTSTKHRRAPAREERWRAIIVGPSAFASGWWTVKKIERGRPTGWMTYTVPEAEIVGVGGQGKSVNGAR